MKFIHLTQFFLSKKKIDYGFFVLQELNVARNSFTAVPSTSLNGPMALKSISLANNSISKFIFNFLSSLNLPIEFVAIDFDKLISQLQV